tara:strand:- start:1363 stop:1782 length:420 start_codon:yes stop_codon:yes gene_type:complete
MYWYVVSMLLALTYVSYIVFSQYIMTTYTTLTDRQVFVNVMCLAGLFCLLTFPQDLIVPEWSPKYALLILIALTLYFQNFLVQMGTKMSFNMGIIDGFAICIYLPVLTLLLYLCFGETITMRKGFGIALACVAGYFILC